MPALLPWNPGKREEDGQRLLTPAGVSFRRDQSQWSSMSVWITWVVVGALTVVTVTQWWQLLSVRSSRQPSGRLLRQSRADGVYDKWLSDHYHLGVDARRAVKDTVFSTGQVPGEPALMEPARALAGEVASGRLPYARPLFWLGWVLAALGAAVSVTGLIDFLTAPDDRLVAVGSIVEGILFAAGLAPAWLLLPGQIRRKADSVLATFAAANGSS